MARFLGLDWGRAKIGMAVADGETRIAFAHGTLANDRKVLERLGEVLRREAIDTVVIGIPSYVNRPETEYDGERAGREIAARFTVRVAYQDEMFTTKLARERLKEKGVRQLDRFDDQEAARIILQEWLDQQPTA